MSYPTDVSWKVERVNSFVTVASFGDGESHIAIDSGCWVVLFEGRLTPWIPEEAAEILKDLPSSPLDYEPYREFVSETCPVCNGNGSPYGKKGAGKPECYYCSGKGVVCPLLEESYVRVIITFLDGKRFEELVSPEGLSKKISATRPDSDGVYTCFLVKEDPKGVFHYEERLRLLQEEPDKKPLDS